MASHISGALWLIFAAVTGVLLIGCVNLAGLQLARAVRADHEMAVRATLGASRTQLAMTRFVESLMIAIMGCLTGIGVAFTGVRIFVALAPVNVPRLDEVEVNWPVLLFAASLSLAAAIIFGIIPALRPFHVAPQFALQSNLSRATSSRHRLRTRSILVASQIACTVVLLVITGLVLRSFSRLLGQERGFDSVHVTLAQVDLFSSQYSDNRPEVQAIKLAFTDSAMTAFEQLPALLLALLGVYGVQAYSVSLRRQEFGIRIAIGSGRAALVHLVLRQAAYPVFAGLIAGLALATLAMWNIRALLYQTPVTDPVVIWGSIILLLAAAALAAILPAFRAASTDPIQTLRAD